MYCLTIPPSYEERGEWVWYAVCVRGREVVKEGGGEGMRWCVLKCGTKWVMCWCVMFCELVGEGWDGCAWEYRLKHRYRKVASPTSYRRFGIG